MRDHKTVYHALIASQQEFGKVNKGSVNPAFKSKYADLSDVASVVIPTLSENGVAVLHYTTTVGDMKCMRTEFYHADSGTKVWCDIELIVDKNNMQGMKSATTYAKRIGLESLSGIAPEDDDGNAAAKYPPKAQYFQQPKSQYYQPQNQAVPEAPKLTEEEFNAKRKAYLDRLETLNDEAVIKATFMEAASGLGLQKGTAEFGDLRKYFVDRIVDIKK